MQKLVLQRFQAAFGKPATLWVKAPGKLNLLGDHTGENGGWALPYAVDGYIAMAAAPVPERCAVRALDTGDKLIFSPTEIPEPRPGHWSHPMLKIMWEFRRRGLPVHAMEAAFSETLPTDSGLSGAGAMACATVLLLDRMAGTFLPKSELAGLCHAAGKKEDWPMDVFAILFGKHDSALLIDGRTLGVTHIPMQIQPYRLIRIHAKLPSGSLRAVLRERQAECLEALEKLRRKRPGLPDLRALDKAGLEAGRGELSPGEHARVLYLIGENQRVLDGEKALLAGDLPTLGKLMNESHASLDRHFQVVEPEMNTLVEMALSQEGVLGARLTGGKGRCTLNLVHRDRASAFAESVKKGFLRKHGAGVDIAEEHPADGAAITVLA